MSILFCHVSPSFYIHTHFIKISVTVFYRSNIKYISACNVMYEYHINTHKLSGTYPTPDSLYMLMFSLHCDPVRQSSFPWFSPTRQFV